MGDETSAIPSVPCQYCGAVNPGQAIKCAECGAPVERPEPVVVREPPAPPPPQGPPALQLSRNWKIGLGVILSLAAFGMVLPDPPKRPAGKPATPARADVPARAEEPAYTPAPPAPISSPEPPKAPSPQYSLNPNVTFDDEKSENISETKAMAWIASPVHEPRVLFGG